MGGWMASRSKSNVSVIIPVYNAQSYLRQSLTSVLAQTFGDFEVICVDDGSTDHSLDLLREFEAADERVKVLGQHNAGAGVARNRALKTATGEYLAFLDADDFFEPTMLEEMVAAAEAKETDVIICRASSYDDITHECALMDNSVKGLEEGVTYASDDLQDVMFQYCIGWPWDKLFRRAFIVEHGLEFQALKSTNDAYFVFIALILAKRVALINRPLVNHRVGNANSIENRRGATWENAFLAADAIEQRLRDERLFEQYEAPFLRWLFTFGLWNFETLHGDSKNGLLNKIQEAVLPRFGSPGANRLLLPHELDYIDMMGRSHADLLQEGIASYWEAKRLRQEAEDLGAQVSYLERGLRECEQSTAYRVGRTVTFVPRAIKKRLSVQHGA